MRCVAIVLAAGTATRFGGDKLAAQIDGRGVLDRAIEIALTAPVERVIVVTAPDRALPSDPRIERVRAMGGDMSDSLRAGLAAAGGADAAFIFLGDMPLVPPPLAEQLLEGIGQAIAAMPLHDGQPGHPVLLSRRGFDLAAGLTGDRGLGSLLRERDDVVRLPVDEAGATFDIDTSDDLRRAQRGDAARTP
jgi:molybdenum cofactor cytidylyltransferase